MFKWIVLTVLINFTLGQDRPIVTIPGQGQVQGIRFSSGASQPTYFAFKGIPFAEPPVGNLRFRNPVPHRGWSGVRDASQHANFCPISERLDMAGGGDEDCLYLNVYTQSLVGSRPVMVYIHGGAFLLGSGDSHFYGPDFFVNEGNVIVVSFNYRLGVFGFFATGDGASQGNWALKDMVVALQWVRNNIQHFGGNPNSITVFGISAGSIGLHYLLLTQQGQGLFNRAILQSGVAINPFAFEPNPLPGALDFGRRLGLTWTSTQDLVNQMRNLPFQTLIDAQSGLMDMAVPRGYMPLASSPVVEPANSPESRFLTDTPTNIMNRGQIMTVPMIIGYMSVESMFMIRETLIDDTVFAQFAANPHFFVPLSFNLHPVNNAPQVNEVATTFRNMYFQGGLPAPETRFNYSQFMTEAHFSFGVDRTVRYLARRQAQPIYYYKFGFDGTLNMLKRVMLLSDYPGAMHGDDIFYMFDVTRFSLPMLPNNAAITVRRRMVRLWSNFATFGDPTPITDSLLPVRWPRYTLNGEEFLDIDENLSVGNSPFNGRIRQWHSFQDRFNPSYPN